MIIGRTATIRVVTACALMASGALIAGPLPRVPEGFVVEQVAGEPEIRFPMFAAFDGNGRLFVAESSGGDLYEELQNLERKCRISVLEDRDGDGSYESAQVFADELVMPMGLAWRDGRLYVAEGPAMIALEDTDDDGRADRRTPILEGFGHSDNGSLHGTTFGPDGLLYMTVGRPDGYRFTAADGKEVWGGTGALIRCRPDGSHPEVVCRGFENLVEIVFLPTGEIVGTDNWFQLPSGGVRDALVHLVEGGKYPLKPDDGSPLPVTGGDLPAIATFPAVSFSGLVQYRETAFPAEMQGDIFAAQFNARRVQRHVLTRDGSTFRAETVDFVESDDPDFHPSDVLVAPDGSLLVIDTGGWYVQHCPTGKIRDSLAPGGIFRVRFTGAPEGEGQDQDVTSELKSMWQLPAPALVQALGAEDLDAVALVARILGARRERGASAPLARLLKTGAPHVRLAAAEALSHCEDVGTLPAIWAALPAASDPFLRHALIHAAFHLADESALRAALSSDQPAVREAALLLLDQPPHSSLTSDDVIAHLSADDRSLRQTAARILQGHSDWEEAAVDLVGGAFAGAELSEADAARVQSLALAFQRQPAMQELVAALVTERSLPVARRVLLLEIMAQSELADLPARWRGALRRTLSDGDAPALRAAAVKAIATVQPAGFDGELRAIAGDEDEDAAVRFDASRALVSRGHQLSTAATGFLASQLAPDVAPLTRLTAAQILAQTGSDPEQLRHLAGADPLIAPLLFPAPAVSDDQQRSQLAKYAPLLTGGGDAAKGRELYFGKAGCAVCHRAGDEGGLIGPDLTGVGAIRARRDLIESIVLPSATFAQRHEPYTITKEGGESVTGTILRESPDSLVVRDVSGAEQRLGRPEIRSVVRSPVSLMPPGLDLLLQPEEFRDLLAYLESLR